MKLGSVEGLYDEAFEERVNYSERYRCIFIHIPKAAGTTVAQLLDLPATSHLTLCELTQTNFFKHHSDLPILAVVRDPISRFISLYNYARMPISQYHNNLDPSQGLYGPHLDYSLLAHASLDQATEHLLAGRLHHDRRWNQWQPQSRWLLSGGAARNPRLQIVRLESLAEGLSSVLGVDSPQLPHANRSSGATEASDLSPAAMARLIDFYSQDYELLNYPRPDLSATEQLWLRAKRQARALLRSAGWRRRCSPGNSPHRH